MDSTEVLSTELGNDLSLSPEHWLSFNMAEKVLSGIALADIVSVQRRGTTKINDATFVLDTGNSDRGLLILPFPDSKRNNRVSAKKRVPEGAVLISRLRPYLQQVAYIPQGVCEILGIKEILCSTEYYVLLPLETGESIAFLVPWLLSEDIQKIFEQAVTGGHHPRFDEDLLMRMRVPMGMLDRRGILSKSVENIVLKHLQSQIGMRNIICDALK